MTHTNENLEYALSRTRRRLELLEARNHPYAQKVREAGLSWRDLDSREALAAFPFTTKQDLQSHYPLGWLGLRPLGAGALSRHLRHHRKPHGGGLHRLRTWTPGPVSWPGVWSWRGCGRQDTVQVAYGYGLFTGGLGLHYGAERLGASVVPASGGFTERQLKLMRDLDVTVLACTPSYALKLAEAWEALGDGPTPLRVGIFGAEPWSEGLRQQIEQRLGLTALDVYGPSPRPWAPEWPWSAPTRTDCTCTRIRSWWRSSTPPRGRPVAPGEVGELVLTSLHKEAFPMIRYRTRDLTRLLEAPCPCGRGGPPDRASPRPQRRHAHRPGGQRVPLPGGVRPPLRGGALGELPAGGVDPRGYAEPEGAL